MRVQRSFETIVSDMSQRSAELRMIQLFFGSRWNPATVPNFDKGDEQGSVV